jgi:hypothetical protein
MAYRISVGPNCARIEPSTNSTIECTTDCGWMTMAICSGAMPNSQCASMTSSPLFMSVAESTVIFGPMRQVGCCSACSGVTRASSVAGSVRNGPPDAVRSNRATSWRLTPCRH